MCTKGGLVVGDCVSLDVDADDGGVHHLGREGAGGRQEVLPMRTTRGIWLIAAVALAVAAAGCGDDDDDVVTIPSSDGSSPSVVMDAHFNVEQRPYMTVANGSAPQQAGAMPDETVTFIAKGSDTDGGVKTIEIWHATDTCRLPHPDPDGLAQACQPLITASLAAKNPDPDIMKMAGASAAKSRTTSYNVHFPTNSAGSFKEYVRAKVVNWAGDAVWSPDITIDGRT
jgi:hypothetical protein